MYTVCCTYRLNTNATNKCVYCYTHTVTTLYTVNKIQHIAITVLQHSKIGLHSCAQGIKMVTHGFTGALWVQVTGN